MEITYKERVLYFAWVVGLPCPDIVLEIRDEEGRWRYDLYVSSCGLGSQVAAMSEREAQYRCVMGAWLKSSGVLEGLGRDEAYNMYDRVEPAFRELAGGKEMTHAEQAELAFGAGKFVELLMRVQTRKPMEDCPRQW